MMVMTMMSQKGVAWFVNTSVVNCGNYGAEMSWRCVLKRKHGGVVDDN